VIEQRNTKRRYRLEFFQQFHRFNSKSSFLLPLEPQLLAEKQQRRNENKLKRNYGGMFEAEAEESDDEDGLQMGVFDCSSGIHSAASIHRHHDLSYLPLSLETLVLACRIKRCKSSTRRNLKVPSLSWRTTHTTDILEYKPFC
jgi:hypothetical protein